MRVVDRVSTGRWAFVAPVLLAAFLGAVPARGQVPEGPRAPRGFSLTAHVDETWESDPIFESRDEPASFVTRMGAGLGYQGGGRRWTLSVGGDGGGVFYHDIPGYNTHFYGGTLSWAQRLSTKTSFTLTENVSDDYARRSTLLVEGGLLFSLVRAFTSRTDARLRHDFSPRTRFETYAGYDYVKFLTGDLLDGRQLSAGLSLSRQIRARSSVGVAYGFTRSMKDLQPSQDVHSGRATWAKAFGRNNTLAASVGATALRRLDRSWSVVPVGNASVSVADPRTRLLMSLRYEHEVNQAFGLAVERVADLLAFSATRPIGRKFSWAAGYGYGLSRDTGADVLPFRFETHNANASLRCAATRTLAVDLGYSFFHTGYYTPAVDNHVLQLSLTYRKGPH